MDSLHPYNDGKREILEEIVLKNQKRMRFFTRFPYFWYYKGRTKKVLWSRISLSAYGRKTKGR